MRASSLIRLALGTGAIAGLLLLAGFFVFCATLPRAGSLPLADLEGQTAAERGIIILTGGAGKRIERGLQLQMDGLADRVLITGVNPTTTLDDLRGMGPEAVLDCCVDLGPRARTTRGNALESREWLDQYGYDAVLLVTSDFHMPRARAELRRTSPGLVIIAIPVATESAPETGWMGRLSSWRLLFGEYLKFLVVSVQSIF